MRRILPPARVGAAILLRVSPRAANRTVNSPYCDPGGNAHGGMLAWDVDTRMDNTHTRGLFLEVTEFDSRSINEVIY